MWGANFLCRVNVSKNSVNELLICFGIELFRHFTAKLSYLKNYRFGTVQAAS